MSLAPFLRFSVGLCPIFFQSNRLPVKKAQILVNQVVGFFPEITKFVASGFSKKNNLETRTHLEYFETKLHNRMRKFFLLAFMLVFAAAAFAQTEEEFEFLDLSDEIEDVEVPPYEKKHYLGDKFTKMFFALKEQYVYIPEKSAINMDPSPTTEKPAIYNSVKKLDKHYRKLLKKGKITKDEVIKKLETIVAVGYSIRHEDTQKLEAMLWKMKDVSKLESLFTEKIVLN